MTTPTHCTRTDPHHPHPMGFESCPGVPFPGVEPPADVQATPDPRLDVVAPGPYAIVRNRLRTHYGEVIVDCAVEILDALGAIPEHAPAPAGLTPQEIRRWIEFGADIATKAIHVTTMVEHGDDETPDSDRVRELERQLTRAVATSEELQARADLAEQRLGHIADALRDWQVDDDEPTNGSERFARAVRECLASTPDDTATAGTATGDE